MNRRMASILPAVTLALRGYCVDVRAPTREAAKAAVLEIRLELEKLGAVVESGDDPVAFWVLTPRTQRRAHVRPSTPRDKRSQVWANARHERVVTVDV